MMERLIGFAARFPRQMLSGLLAITLLAALCLSGLDVRISVDAMEVGAQADRQVYEQARQRFGSSDVVVVLVSDAAPLSAQKLAAIRPVVERLEALPFVAGTDSLFSLPHGRVDDDDTLHLRPFLDPLPTNDDAAMTILRAASANRFAADNLISGDGRTLAINIRLKPDVHAAGNDEARVDAIDSAIAPLRDELDEVFALGPPHVDVSLSEHVIRDQATLLPLSFVVLLLVLLLALGHWQGVVVPLLTASASVVWTLALMAVAGVPLNVMTSVIPLLLIVVGSTEDVHMLAAYFARRRDGLGPEQALQAMAAGTGLAVLLTFATTYIGFLSISLNDIRLLREFGLIASSGLFFNFIITSLTVPAVLAHERAGSRGVAAGPDRYKWLAGVLYRFAMRHRVLILITAAMLFVVSLLGAARLQVNSDMREYLPSDSPLTRQSQLLHDRLAGVQVMDVILSSGIDGTFERTRYLAEIDKLQAFLDATQRFDKTLSFVDVLKEMNRVMQGLGPGELELPDDDALVREYLLFLDQALRRAYVTDDLSAARIGVRHDITASSEFSAVLAQMRAFVDEQIAPGIVVDITGSSVLSHRAANTLAVGQAKSLLLVMLAIFVLISIVFVDARAGLLAVVPNMLPTAVLFGVMGFAGVPLSTGTAMVAAIAVGICVDNTIHFLLRYHRCMADNPLGKAIHQTMAEEARPILSTAVALVMGFGVLALSSFPPVVYFGVLAALAFMLSALATFLLTPILLKAVRLVTLWDLLGVSIQSRLISDCVLFQGMRRFQVRKLIAISTRRVFAAGDVIVREGDTSRELFVVLEGQVRAQRRSACADPELLNTMEVGDVFGEIALTARTPRTADVVALERTEVLVMHWDDLLALNRHMPRTASRLLLNIASRMGQRLVSRHF